MDSRDSIEQHRKDFPSLSRERNGKPPIYLDNACTALVPQLVIDAINEYYENYPSCGGRRSHHWYAERVNSRIDGNAGEGSKGSRQMVAEFINARSEKEILFTLNTTHAINTVALGFDFHPGDVVLLGDKEHNSNLLPWLKLQQAGRLKVECLKAGPQESFDLQAYEQKLKTEQVRLVSLGYTSNVTGCTLPAREIVKLAHQYGARVLLDAAQTVPHQAVDVQDLEVDFLAFSLHKMCGPRGVGVLFGKQELLNRIPVEKGGCADAIEPTILGGGTADESTYQTYSLLATPDKYEAGIQNYPGLIASGATVQYLSSIGMDRIAAQEIRLNNYLTKELVSRYGNGGWFRIFGPEDAALRSGILTFEVRRPNAIGIARELNVKNNIMIRDGVFCVHSYFNNQFGLGWIRPKSHQDHRMIYRVSLYFYNTIEECQVFIETLDEIFKERSYIW